MDHGNGWAYTDYATLSFGVIASQSIEHNVSITGTIFCALVIREAETLPILHDSEWDSVQCGKKKIIHIQPHCEEERVGYTILHRTVTIC